MYFTRSGGLPEAPGARILCILRGPAVPHKPPGRESYVFYEVQRPPINPREASGRQGAFGCGSGLRVLFLGDEPPEGRRAPHEGMPPQA